MNWFGTVALVRNSQLVKLDCPLLSQMLPASISPSMFLILLFEAVRIIRGSVFSLIFITIVQAFVSSRIDH